MNNLHGIIVKKIELLIAQKIQPSKIMRKIFLEFGEIPPPIMAQYFKSIYFLPAIEFMYALGAWWHNELSEISDDEFDRRFLEIINRKDD